MQKIDKNNFVSMAVFDSMNIQNLKIQINGRKFLVKDILDNNSFDRKRLVSSIRLLIKELNGGFDFGSEVTDEWVKYLILLMKGYGKNLINPYNDIINYEIKPISQKLKNLNDINTIQILDDLPINVLNKASFETNAIINKTLLIIALGGVDSTFYKELSKENGNILAKSMYSKNVFNRFKKYHAQNIIPRGLAVKKDSTGNYHTNLESMILHAYNAGIRCVLVIGNAKTYEPIKYLLLNRLNKLKDLKIIIKAQPLLPVIRVKNDINNIFISFKNGSYPGGSGHGLKYCFHDQEVSNLIRKNHLEFFIFGNGDNSVMLNWGVDHYIYIIKKMKTLKQQPEYNNLIIAFFLVWEYFRKGGFSFLLKHKKSGNQIAQIFEAELAGQSGVDIKQLETNRGGYNTNVAVGMLRDVIKHLENLPMALKNKTIDGYNSFLFEASLSPSMTTQQKKDGTSIFNINSSINVIGPVTAKYQHWNHISIRKRDDMFAYFSSLFKFKTINTDYGTYPVIVTERDATKPYPVLKGNFIDPVILNTKEFFEIFKDAYINIDDFYGTLNINLLEDAGIPRGKIKFEGTIIFIGTGEISINVPAGAFLLLRNRTIDAADNTNINLSKNL
jgi:hypothetical protein